VSTDPSVFPKITAVLQEWIASGHQIGAQVYISRDAQPLADFAIGESRPGVPMRTDTLMLWLSASKPLAAVALAQLRERGLLDFDDPVVKFIPEFAANGKERITLKHILTHTAGLRFINFDWPQTPWDQIIALICAAAPEANWPPGEKAGYSPFASWFILAEVVRRLDGLPYEDYVRQQIFSPLGMDDSWLAMPPERYRAYGDRIGIMMNTAKKPATPSGDDTEEAAAACRPSGGGRGPARELARFYEMMLNSGAASEVTSDTPPLPPEETSVSSVEPGRGEGARQLRGASLASMSKSGNGEDASDDHQIARQNRRILTPESVQLLLHPHRVGLFDHTFRNVMDWGLGFMVNSAKYGEATVPYGYGPNSSQKAFGHGGARSTCAFADPDRRLAVVIVFNGQPGEPAHHRRLRATLAAMEEDLGAL
jgi:CubicO group peptidase (beta-lactamase class C family)